MRKTPVLPIATWLAFLVCLTTISAQENTKSAPEKIPIAELQVMALRNKAPSETQICGVPIYISFSYGYHLWRIEDIFGARLLCISTEHPKKAPLCVMGKLHCFQLTTDRPFMLYEVQFITERAGSK